MPQLYVVDTNVVVSGALAFDRATPPSSILRGMLEGRVPFALSVDLLTEYRVILQSTPIASRLKLQADEVDRVLAEITVAAYLRQPASELQADSDDPPPRIVKGDEHIIHLLAHEPRAALVSGDQPLLRALQGWREMLTPGEAVSRFAPNPEGQV